MDMQNPRNRSGEQSKAAILARSGLMPLVVSVPEAAALIGLSKNSARQLFEERAVPIVSMGKTRKVVRLADLQRVLEEIAREVGHDH